MHAHGALAKFLIGLLLILLPAELRSALVGIVLQKYLRIFALRGFAFSARAHANFCWKLLYVEILLVLAQEPATLSLLR